MTSREAAKEIRTFDLSPHLLRWWQSIYWQVANVIYRQERNQNFVQGGLSIISVLGLAAGAGWAAWTVVQGTLSAAQFGAMLFALQAVKYGVSTIAGRMSYFRDRMLHIDDLFAYLDLAPEESPDGVQVNLNVDIEVQGVSFHYPQSQDYCLRDVSFTLKSGEKLALVGNNGSGKTTLVKLMLGLYQPIEGNIRYGSIPFSEADLNYLRSQSSAVFQDFIRYAFTLRDNIGYGKAELLHDQEMVEMAAKLGGADQVAATLSEGYETFLTKAFANGTDLSGGQWQRVAISRAFMRNAPLVVLDEPSAALDPMAEADVFARFAEAAGNKTAILVSHRLGMARFCDRILVLKNGSVAEIGTHDELLAAEGEYSRLWSLQSEWYKEREYN